MGNPLDNKQIVDNQVGMFHWVQEFSKKIVTITFAIFVVIHIYILIIFAIEYFTNGNVEDVTTLLSEMHTTFREVIGAYFLKAAVENGPKVVGSIIDRYLEVKYPTTESNEVFENEEEIYSDTRGIDC